MMSNVVYTTMLTRYAIPFTTLTAFRSDHEYISDKNADDGGGKRVDINKMLSLPLHTEKEHE
jgi:hypothetical protein